MKPLVSILLIFTIVIIVIALFSPKMVQEKNAHKFIPMGAEFVEDLGKGWIVFELNGQKYMYHRRAIWYFFGAHAQSCVTPID